MTLVSLSKMLYYDCFSSPRSIKYKWVPARVEVGIVYEKATEGATAAQSFELHKSRSFDSVTRRQYLFKSL